MRQINDCTIAGRLGSDAEGKLTPTGHEVCTFSMAYDMRRKNQAGEWETTNTSWLRVSLFDRRAHEIAASLHKGDFVTAHGRVDLRTFQKKDGTEGYSFEMQADAISAAVRLGSNSPGAGGGFGGHTATTGFGSQGFDSPAAGFDDGQPPF